MVSSYFAVQSLLCKVSLLKLLSNYAVLLDASISQKKNNQKTIILTVVFSAVLCGEKKKKEKWKIDTPEKQRGVWRVSALFWKLS